MRLNFLWNIIKDYYLFIIMVWFFGAILLRKNRHYQKYLICSAIVYLLLLIYVTLLGRTSSSEYQMELAFLWEYRLALEGNYSWWMQIFDNIMLFVPMGWLYGEVRDKTTWIRAFLLGVVGAGWVEILQLVLKLGLFEWDDIFNNTIGMMLGYGICRAVVRHDGRRSCRS